MRRARSAGARLSRGIAAMAIAAALACSCGKPGPTTLRYAHMNASDSAAGMQASYFARRASELSGGRLAIEVYPNSSLGSLVEQLGMVVSGAVDIHHTTAGALGSLSADFALLDTPYLVSDVERLMRIADRDSPVMRRLGRGLSEAGLNVLYTFYFGARQLSCDRVVLRPEDLEGVAIRAIPFPMYMRAVEILGGVPTPIDWALTPTALAAGVVHGQENPTDTILSAKLYEVQPYLMMTSHILGAEIVVINARTMGRLPKKDRAALLEAAADAGRYGTELLLAQEERSVAALRERGMTVVGPAEGLDIEAFRARASAAMAGDARWGDYYAMIEAIK